jgi:hypothetical protein
VNELITEMLNHPAVQGGVAPFAVALLIVFALGRIGLAGLAVAAALMTAVALASGISFSPLTAARKIMLLALAAPVAGLLLDFAFKPTRLGNALIAIACAAASVWVFWSVLAQKEFAQAMLTGGTVAAFVAATIAIGSILSAEPVRAGAAGLCLGLGAGISAMLGASAVFALYGIALGAASGAFLLVQMLSGRKMQAGATFMLPAMLAPALLASGTMVLATLPWYALPALALAPAATLVPLPRNLPVWQEAVLRSLCGLLVAAVACGLTWQYAGKVA